MLPLWSYNEEYNANNEYVNTLCCETSLALSMSSSSLTLDSITDANQRIAKRFPKCATAVGSQHPITPSGCVS
jgi:hypothetical protein